MSTETVTQLLGPPATSRPATEARTTTSRADDASARNRSERFDTVLSRAGARPDTRVDRAEPGAARPTGPTTRPGSDRGRAATRASKPERGPADGGPESAGPDDLPRIDDADSAVAPHRSEGELVERDDADTDGGTAAEPNTIANLADAALAASASAAVTAPSAPTIASSTTGGDEKANGAVDGLPVAASLGGPGRPAATAVSAQPGPTGHSSAGSSTVASSTAGSSTVTSSTAGSSTPDGSGQLVDPRATGPTTGEPGLVATASQAASASHASDADSTAFDSEATGPGGNLSSLEGKAVVAGGRATDSSGTMARTKVAGEASQTSETDLALGGLGRAVDGTDAGGMGPTAAPSVDPVGPAATGGGPGQDADPGQPGTGGATDANLNPVDSSLSALRRDPPGPTASSAASPGGPTRQADGSDPVWRQVQRALSSVRLTAAGDHEMTIRLRPDELGSVVVKVITGEAGTTVALMAESRSAANHLQQQRHLLLNELEESGLRGTTIDIGMGNGSAQNQPRDETAPGTTRTGLRSSAMKAEAKPSRDRTAQRTRTTSSGTVDLAL